MAAPAVGVNVALPGLSLPGLTGLPTMDFGSAANSALNTSGSLYQASGPGDWVVNFGGSNSGFGGFGGSASSGALGATAGGIPSWLIVAGVVVAAWAILKN